MANLISLLRRFRRADDGAVTVDWVVATSIVIALAFPLVGVIKGGQDVLAGKIGTSVANKKLDQ